MLLGAARLAVSDRAQFARGNAVYTLPAAVPVGDLQATAVLSPVAVSTGRWFTSL